MNETLDGYIKQLNKEVLDELNTGNVTQSRLQFLCAFLYAVNESRIELKAEGRYGDFSTEDFSKYVQVILQHMDIDRIIKEMAEPIKLPEGDFKLNGKRE